MLEAARGAERVDAPQEAPDPLAVVLGTELRPLPAATRVDGEAEAVVRRDRPIAELAAGRQLERRDHGNFRRRERAREVVLLGDRFVAPAARPVELDDDRLGVFDADLEYAVFVAAERQDTPVAGEVRGLDGVDHGIR